MQPPAAGSGEQDYSGQNEFSQDGFSQQDFTQSEFTQQDYAQSAFEQAASGEEYGSAGGAGTVDYANPVPGLTFMEAVSTCFSKYVMFSGRARRSEFWYFTLFIFVVNMALGWIGNRILGVPEGGGPNRIQGFFALLVLLPSMSVFWRRMHDIGKSGLWYLLNLIPLAGTLILVAFEIRDSEPGENQYGMSPKYPLK